jgi:hypothetical protein
MNETGRDRARQAVADEMVRQDMGPVELSRKAGVDAGTAGDFLIGKRWPNPASRRKLAEALGWAAESIDRLARGEDPILADPAETVGTSTSEDAGVLLDMPPEALEGLGPAEREEVITAAKLSALATAREIRRRLGQ